MTQDAPSPVKGIAPTRVPLDRPRRQAAMVLAAGAALVLAVAPALAAPPSRPAPALPPRAADARPASVVAVFGDGYAEALTEGLRADAAGRSDTTVLAATHAPSGLADASHYDWKAAAAELLAHQHVDQAVVMLGANDREPLADGTAVAEPLGARWRVLYAERVQALADVFREAKVPLIWVGLPIVADEAMSADFVALNEITRDRVTTAGGTYVDSWNAFTDEGGKYDAFGPDAMGRMTRLRTADGLDLTRAGAIKLASFVEVELRAAHTAAAPAPTGTDFVLPHQPDFDDASTNDVNAQIRREAGLPALPGAATTRAERGPVIALTAPALSEGGRLVAPSPQVAPLLGTSGTAVERALVEGLPIPPKAGRTDDFSWPK